MPVKNSGISEIHFTIIVKQVIKQFFNLCLLILTHAFFNDAQIYNKIILFYVTRKTLIFATPQMFKMVLLFTNVVGFSFITLQ